MEKGNCPLCGCWRYLQRDHIVPRFVFQDAHDAEHPDNVQKICFDCHVDKTRSDVSLLQTGRKWSAAHREKMLIARAGYKHSQETKEKITAAALARSAEHSARMKQWWAERKAQQNDGIH